MSKKKLISMMVAGVLTLGIVGGTLAWFTSEDSVTNKFTTGGNIEETLNGGLDIYEKFDKVAAENATPGAVIEKNVQVKNEATYDQYIRVKFNKTWTKAAGITETLDTNKIELVFNGEGGKLPTDWIQDGDYYYYVGKTASNSFTSLLLKDVEISSSCGNEYKGAKFDVEVVADSIQTSNGVLDDTAVWPEASKATRTALKNSRVTEIKDASKTEATNGTKEFGPGASK